MEKKVKIFETPRDVAEAFAGELIIRFSKAAETGTAFTVALSGGSTPGILYSVMAEKYGNSVDWRFIHFFWGDERCVPQDDIESNYGMAYNKFLSRIDIPAGNIHRVYGEETPSLEAVRYSDEILLNTRNLNGLPVFDQIILGMGEDGHTVSIFPSNRELLSSDKVCDVAAHPVTGQKRITITGKVINNSDAVAFLVTGGTKSDTVEQIFSKKYDLPASNVLPAHGVVTWFMDKDAAAKIR